MISDNPGGWKTGWPVHFSSILSLGRYRGPRHRDIRPMITSPGTQKVELITAGEVYFEVNGKDRLYGCGGIFWHLPGELTIHRAVPSNPYECITIVFEVDPSFDTLAGPRIPRVSRWEDPATVKKFGADILEKFHRERMDKDILLQYVYSRLCWHIYQYHHRITEKNRPVPLRSVLEYIEDNLAGDLSLVTLSAYARLSTSQLHVLFHKHLGLTPHGYIVERRLQEARNLLAGSELKIGEICDRCGFLNSETFNRAFKKSTGLTPSRFRVSQRPVG